MINNWISTINSNRENLAIITYEPSIEQLIFTLKSSLSNIVSINYNHTESIDITKILKDFSKYSEGEQIQTALYIKSVAKPNIFYVQFTAMIFFLNFQIKKL